MCWINFLENGESNTYFKGGDQADVRRVGKRVPGQQRHHSPDEKAAHVGFIHRSLLGQLVQGGLRGGRVAVQGDHECLHQQQQWVVGPQDLQLRQGLLQLVVAT